MPTRGTMLFIVGLRGEGCIKGLSSDSSSHTDTIMFDPNGSGLSLGDTDSLWLSAMAIAVSGLLKEPITISGSSKLQDGYPRLVLRL